MNPGILEAIAKASDLRSLFHGYKTIGSPSPNPGEVDRMARARISEVVLELRLNKQAETKITTFHSRTASNHG